MVGFHDKSFLESFNKQAPSHPDDPVFHSFSTLIKQPFCSPMKVNAAMSELPKGAQLMCSWLPKGQRVFLYIVNGKGYLVNCFAVDSCADWV